MNPLLSNSQVDRAGEILRLHGLGESVELTALTDSMVTLTNFRQQHVVPLTTAAMGLRSGLTKHGFPVQVSQRLKRIPTILDKLQRESSVRLSRLQDIGGCRAVLPDVKTLRSMQDYLADPSTGRTRELVRIKDYVSTPKDDGYRAVHVVVRYQERLIEVQLRTRVMNLFASTIERLTQIHGENLRDPRDPAIREYFALISHALAAEEAGQEVSRALLARIDEMRVIFMAYLDGRRT